MVDDPTTSLGDLPLICTLFQDLPSFRFVRSTRASENGGRGNGEREESCCRRRLFGGSQNEMKV